MIIIGYVINFYVVIGVTIPRFSETQNNKIDMIFKRNQY